MAGASTYLSTGRLRLRAGRTCPGITQHDVTQRQLTGALHKETDD